MGHKTFRDFISPKVSVVLSEQTERKGEQEMLRDYIRGKVMLVCAWRCLQNSTGLGTCQTRNGVYRRG